MPNDKMPSDKFMEQLQRYINEGALIINDGKISRLLTADDVEIKRASLKNFMEYEANPFHTAISFVEIRRNILRIKHGKEPQISENTIGYLLKYFENITDDSEFMLECLDGIINNSISYEKLYDFEKCLDKHWDIIKDQ